MRYIILAYNAKEQIEDSAVTDSEQNAVILAAVALRKYHKVVIEKMGGESK